MPPVFGPLSPSPTRLWSCAEASWIAVSPSHSAKNEASSPTEAFLDHDFPGRRAEAAAEHHVDRGFRLLHGLRDDHAFAGGKPVRLHDDRRACLAHIVLRGACAFEALIGGGRDVVGLAKVLGEAFRAFESRRPFRRAERLDAGAFEIVDNAGAERHFRSDDDEVDFLLLAKRDHRRVVAEVERHAFGLLRDAGIAGGAIELVGERAGRHLPGQRMLASAGTNNKDVHGTRRRPLEDGRHLV